jgi:hypothetical protein
LAKIDSHIAILHLRLDRVAKIAPRDDLDFRVAIRKIADGFSHATGCANQQYTRRKLFHFAETLTSGKGEATRVSLSKFAC